VAEQLANVTALSTQFAAQLAQSMAELTKLKKERQDNARDMLLRGTPVAYISKWTSLSEDEINRMKADMDVPSVSKENPDDNENK